MMTKFVAWSLHLSRWHGHSISAVGMVTRSQLIMHYLPALGSHACSTESYFIPSRNTNYRTLASPHRCIHYPPAFLKAPLATEQGTVCASCLFLIGTSLLAPTRSPLCRPNQMLAKIQEESLTKNILFSSCSLVLL